MKKRLKITTDLQVLVAKHHDGFCMFDSQLTDYKITNTPFKRDVCAELAAACHKADMLFGFYYSPPDWHHPDFLTKHHDRYLEYMHGQVRELLTHYGKVDILWFDTDGGLDKPETWDNATLFPMIRQLQPEILLTKRCGGWGDFDTPEQLSEVLIIRILGNRASRSRPTATGPGAAATMESNPRKKS